MGYWDLNIWEGNEACVNHSELHLPMIVGGNPPEALNKGAFALLSRMQGCEMRGIGLANLSSRLRHLD
jgi:hypothetical protein